jgi:hypothetical protein
MAKRSTDPYVSLTTPSILEKLSDYMMHHMLAEHFYNIRFHGEASPLNASFLCEPNAYPENEQQCRAEQCYVDSCIELDWISNDGIGVEKRKKK